MGGVDNFTAIIFKVTGYRWCGIFIQQWFLIWHWSEQLIPSHWNKQPQHQGGLTQSRFLFHSHEVQQRLGSPPPAKIQRSGLLVSCGKATWGLCFQKHKWKWQRALGEGEPDTWPLSPEGADVTSDHILWSRTSQMASVITRKSGKWRCNTWIVQHY